MRGGIGRAQEPAHGSSSSRAAEGEQSVDWPCIPLKLP